MPNFLHLSDLHYQLIGSNPEECSENEERQNNIVTALLADIRSENKKSKINFVIFSGDLVQSGSEDSFNLFHEHFAVPLMQKLELPMERLFIVPGNHDIKIADVSAKQIDHDKNEVEKLIQSNGIEDAFEKLCNDNAEPYLALLLDRFKPFNNYKNRLYQSLEGDGEKHSIFPLFSTHIFTCGSYQIGIACFNSCFTCFGEKSDECINRLYFPMAQINCAVKKLENAQVKIAIFHHPIHWFRSWANSNSTRVESKLIEKFDFIMYGHVHQEDTRSKTEEDSNACFCQGGYLSLRNKNHSTYSIISFDDPNNRLKGVIEFREYNQGKFDIQCSAYVNGQKPFTIEKNAATFPDASKGPLQINTLLSPQAFLQKIKTAVPCKVPADSCCEGYDHDIRNLVYTNKFINNVNFSSVNFSSAIFSGTQFKLCHFSDVNLNNTDFKGCVFKEVDFTHVDSFFSVAYNFRQQLLCVGGTGVLVFFDSKDNNITKTVILKGEFQKVLSLNWYDDLLAMTSSDGCIAVWDADKRNEPIFMRKDESFPVYAATWSPDGKYLASTYYKTGIRIFSMCQKNGENCLEHITTLNGDGNTVAHTKQILTLSWSPDGSWLISAGIDKIINVWNVKDINEWHHIRMFTLSHYDYIRKLVWFRSAKAFFSCSDDGNIKAWAITDVTGGDEEGFCEISEVCVEPGEDNNGVLSMAISPSKQENLLAVGLRDDQIALIRFSDDFTELERIYISKMHKGRVWDLCWDKDGSRLFSVGNEGRMKVCHYADHKLNTDKTMDYEVKISCSNMQIHGAKGLEERGYQVTENKDMPDQNINGTLGDFLTSKGAIGYEK